MASKDSSKKRLDYFKDASTHLMKADERSAIYQLKRGLILKYAHGNAIDIGAGNGVYTEWLASVCDKVVALDESASMLVHLIHRTNDFKNIKYEIGDAIGFPYKSESFDIGVSYSTLYYIDGYFLVLLKMAQALKPNSVLIFDVTNSFSLGALYSKYRWPIDQYNVSITDIKSFLSFAGYEIVEEHKTELLPRVNIPVLKNILDVRIGNISLDELISSLPILRMFAFRTTFVVTRLAGVAHG